MPVHGNAASDVVEVDEPRREVEREIRRMLDRALPLVLLLALGALASSVIRAVHDGWQNLFSLHVGLVVCAGIVYAVRSRLPFRVLVGALLGMATVDGLANMLTYGIASNGFMVLACMAVLASLAFGRRGALGGVGVAVVVWVGAGVLFVTGGKDLGDSLVVQLYSPWSWLSQIAAAVLFTTVVVRAAHVTQRRLARSLVDEQGRRRELETLNRELSMQVAQRERAERDLADRERTFRLLAENMEDGLFVQGMNLEPVYANPACERLLGYSRDELMRMRMSDIMTPDSLQRAMALFSRYVQLAMEDESVEVPLMEYEYVRKDGSTFWGELRVGFLRDASGKPERTQGILRDVTERRRAEEEKVRLESQLQQAEKMRAIGQLAGGIAHDFNNQLTGITMGAGLIARGLPDQSEIRRYVEFVQTCAKRSSDLTLKLLAFGRNEPSVASPTRMHDVVREVVAILEHSVDKGIRIESRLEAARSVVRADAAQLQSALLNIGLNARDAMPRGGTLTFVSQTDRVQAPRATASGIRLAPGDYLRLRVTDTGLGMDELTRKRIFEPFFTTKPRGQGTGLGLSTVYGTISGLGGAIDVESSPGQGTTFEVYLPLTQEEGPAGEVPYVTPKAGAGRLLLVDDETTVRLATEEMLRALGYQVRGCEDGERAIAIHEREGGTFRALVLDVSMPKVGGRDVFLAVRARDPRARVLFVSGYAPEGELGPLLREQYVRFLQKPFTEGELSSALEALLDG
jgi:PAS domain S-box-containing protein